MLSTRQLFQFHPASACQQNECRHMYDNGDYLPDPCACGQAGQDFDPSDRSVINRGELLGSQVVVSAQGTYEPQVMHCAVGCLLAVIPLFLVWHPILLCLYSIQLSAWLPDHV